MNIVCVYRASHFSPNMEDSDAAILNAVADNLLQMGHVVQCIHEEQLVQTDFEHIDVVYSMGRAERTLDILQEVESNGVKVINPSAGIRNCERKLFTQILMDEDVPFPTSRVFRSADSITWDIYPCWLKKGEGYAQVAEDVVFVKTPQMLACEIQKMRERGIESMVVSQHLDGDLIKFYGVKGTSFFYWYYASEGHSKFGLEIINGKEHGYHFSEQQLHNLCNHAATVLGLDVYGGDCVVSKDGLIQVIDMNDWPSFSRCREQAAEIITKNITE